MPPVEGSPADPTSGVARGTTPWRVKQVTPRPGLRLLVEFADGTTGEVLLQPSLESERVTGTVFEALRDPAVFSQVRLESGAVTWPNGADLAPDAMYDAIRATGRWRAGEEAGR